MAGVDGGRGRGGGQTFTLSTKHTQLFLTYFLKAKRRKLLHSQFFTRVHLTFRARERERQRQRDRERQRDGETERDRDRERQ